MSDMPNRIREHRQARGMTLDQVARAVGCSTVQVSDLERGKRGLTTDWLRRIATVLKVDSADLLLEADNALGLSVEERDLVLRFRTADPETRAKMRAMIELMAPDLATAQAAKAA